MNPEDIGKILDEIGERIGPAGEYAWELTVRQIMLEGLLGTVLGGILTLAALAASIAALAFIARRHNSDKANYVESSYSRFDPFGYFMSAGSVVALAGVVVLILGSGFYISLLRLLNPEYHAMQRLLTMVLP